MGSSIGQGSIGVTPKSEGGGMPGPPFDPTSANEGLSVDSVTGKIVLGNDTGDPAFPGRIEGFREVAIFPGGQLIWNISGNADMQILFENDFFGANGFSVSGQNNGGGNNRVLQMDANGINIAANSSVFIPGSNSSLNLSGSVLIAAASDGTDDSELIISGGSSVFNKNGNPLLSISDANIQTTVPINTATANPLILPNGATAEWYLGTVVAAASVLDNTQYVEVNISGTVYKLALIV